MPDKICQEWMGLLKAWKHISSFVAGGSGNKASFYFFRWTNALCFAPDKTMNLASDHDLNDLGRKTCIRLRTSSISYESMQKE